MKTLPAITAILANLPSDQIEGLPITSVTVASPRTLKIALKTPAPDGTNQIKITLENGKFTVRGYRVEETEIAENIDGDMLIDALFGIANGANAATKSLLASVLKNAAGK